MIDIPIKKRRPGEAVHVDTTGPITMVCYGESRSGKTAFGATMERPLVLADATEGGWTTIQTMDQNLWYEPDVEPIVWGIKTITDVPAAIQRAQPLIASGRIKSLVFSSITFYADLYLKFLTDTMGGANADNRKVYGALGVHLRQLRVDIHNLGLNTSWEALVQEADDEHPKARPAIPGNQGPKFAAGCSYLFYFNRTVTAARPGAPGTPAIPAQQKFEIRTAQFGKYIAGGRDGGVLADPLPGRTFRDLQNALSRGINTPVASVPSTPGGEAPAASPIASPAAVSPGVAPAKRVFRRPGS